MRGNYISVPSSEQFSESVGQNCNFFMLPLSSDFKKRLGYKVNNTRYISLTSKPRSHVRILIYRTWPTAHKRLYFTISLGIGYWSDGLFYS